MIATNNPLPFRDNPRILAPPILASASPRRRHWFEALRIPFEVQVPNVDEEPLPNEDPVEMVRRLAMAKANEVATINPARWVIAADTTVAVDHHVLGKPVDFEDAVRMLKLLQGRGHQVHTGLCLQHNQDVHVLVDTANVFFRSMSEPQIRWYIATGEPMDKAGSYAAQGIFALFIQRIEGSFSTVMGLPVERLGELLQDLGLLSTWIHLP